MVSEREPKNTHLIMELIENLVNSTHDMVSGEKLRIEETVCAPKSEKIHK